MTSNKDDTPPQELSFSSNHLADGKDEMDGTLGWPPRADTMPSSKVLESLSLLSTRTPTPPHRARGTGTSTLASTSSFAVTPESPASSVGQTSQHKVSSDAASNGLIPCEISLNSVNSPLAPTTRMGLISALDEPAAELYSDQIALESVAGEESARQPQSRTKATSEALPEAFAHDAFLSQLHAESNAINSVLAKVSKSIMCPLQTSEIGLQTSKSTSRETSATTDSAFLMEPFDKASKMIHEYPLCSSASGLDESLDSSLSSKYGSNTLNSETPSTLSPSPSLETLHEISEPPSQSVSCTNYISRSTKGHTVLQREKSEPAWGFTLPEENNSAKTVRTSDSLKLSTSYVINRPISTPPQHHVSSPQTFPESRILESTALILPSKLGISPDTSFQSPTSPLMQTPLCRLTLNEPSNSDKYTSEDSEQSPLETPTQRMDMIETSLKPETRSSIQSSAHFSPHASQILTSSDASEYSHNILRDSSNSLFLQTPFETLIATSSFSQNRYESSPPEDTSKPFLVSTLSAQTLQRCSHTNAASVQLYSGSPSPMRISCKSSITLPPLKTHKQLPDCVVLTNNSVVTKISTDIHPSSTGASKMTATISSVTEQVQAQSASPLPPDLPIIELPDNVSISCTSSVKTLLSPMPAQRHSPQSPFPSIHEMRTQSFLRSPSSAPAPRKISTPISSRVSSQEETHHTPSPLLHVQERQKTPLASNQSASNVPSKPMMASPAVPEEPSQSPANANDHEVPFLASSQEYSSCKSFSKRLVKSTASKADSLSFEEITIEPETLQTNIPCKILSKTVENSSVKSRAETRCNVSSKEVEISSTTLKLSRNSLTPPTPPSSPSSLHSSTSKAVNSSTLGAENACNFFCKREVTSPKASSTGTPLKRLSKKVGISSTISKPSRNSLPPRTPPPSLSSLQSSTSKVVNSSPKSEIPCKSKISPITLRTDTPPESSSKEDEISSTTSKLSENSLPPPAPPPSLSSLQSSTSKIVNSSTTLGEEAPCKISSKSVITPTTKISDTRRKLSKETLHSSITLGTDPACKLSSRRVEISSLTSRVEDPCEISFKRRFISPTSSTAVLRSVSSKTDLISAPKAREETPRRTLSKSEVISSALSMVKDKGSRRTSNALVRVSSTSLSLATAASETTSAITDLHKTTHQTQEFSVKAVRSQMYSDSPRAEPIFVQQHETHVATEASGDGPLAVSTLSRNSVLPPPAPPPSPSSPQSSPSNISSGTTPPASPVLRASVTPKVPPPDQKKPRQESPRPLSRESWSDFSADSEEAMCATTAMSSPCCLAAARSSSRSMTPPPAPLERKAHLKAVTFSGVTQPPAGQESAPRAQTEILTLMTPRMAREYRRRPKRRLRRQRSLAQLFTLLCKQAASTCAPMDAKDPDKALALALEQGGLKRHLNTFLKQALLARQHLLNKQCQSNEFEKEDELDARRKSSDEMDISPCSSDAATLVDAGTGTDSVELNWRASPTTIGTIGTIGAIGAEILWELPRSPAGEAASRHKMKESPSARSTADLKKRARASAKGRAAAEGAQSPIAVSLRQGPERRKLEISQWHVSDEGLLVLTCPLGNQLCARHLAESKPSDTKQRSVTNIHRQNKPSAAPQTRLPKLPIIKKPKPRPVKQGFLKTFSAAPDMQNIQQTVSSLTSSLDFRQPIVREASLSRIQTAPDCPWSIGKGSGQRVSEPSRGPHRAAGYYPLCNQVGSESSTRIFKKPSWTNTSRSQLPSAAGKKLLRQLAPTAQNRRPVRQRVTAFQRHAVPTRKQKVQKTTDRSRSNQRSESNQRRATHRSASGSHRKTPRSQSDSRRSTSESHRRKKRSTSESGKPRASSQPSRKKIYSSHDLHRGKSRSISGSNRGNQPSTSSSLHQRNRSTSQSQRRKAGSSSTTRRAPQPLGSHRKPPSGALWPWRPRTGLRARSGRMPQTSTSRNRNAGKRTAAAAPATQSAKHWPAAGKRKKKRRTDEMRRIEQRLAMSAWHADSASSVSSHGSSTASTAASSSRSQLSLASGSAHSAFSRMPFYNAAATEAKRLRSARMKQRILRQVHDVLKAKTQELMPRNQQLHALPAPGATGGSRTSTRRCRAKVKKKGDKA